MNTIREFMELGKWNRTSPLYEWWTNQVSHWALGLIAATALGLIADGEPGLTSYIRPGWLWAGGSGHPRPALMRTDRRK